MNIAHHKKFVAVALGTAIASAMTPALLFVGAGTAHAQKDQDVTWDPWVPGVGLTVHVQDNTGVTHDCAYYAEPQPGQLPLPLYVHKFHLPAWQTVSWPITTYDWPLPAVATGTVWKVNVSCGNHGSTWVKTF